MVGQRQVIVARFGRVLLQRMDVVLVAFEVVFLEVAERLTIGTRLVCATMSDVLLACYIWLADRRCDLLSKVVRARKGLVAQGANVWSFLCVGAHVSKRPVSVYPKTKIAPNRCSTTIIKWGNCGRLPLEVL